MTPVRWTLQAADDLAAIKEFIGRDSPTYARAVVERLFLAAMQLGQFPDMGRVVPERADPRIRELLRPPYRIVYRRGEAAVEILAVHHSARLFPPDEPGGAG